MTDPRSDELTIHPRGVHVTVAESERRRSPRWVFIVVLVVAVVLASAGVLVTLRNHRAQPGVPATELDAQKPPEKVVGVPGSTRLVLLGPLALLDTRNTAALAPGASADLSLPGLPPGSTAILVEVSVVGATGTGEVAIGPAGAEAVVLSVPKAGAQTSTTTVVPLAAGGLLRIRTAAGGQLVVNLVGAFEPAQRSTGGRVVPIAAARVVRLVPEVDGRKDATIDLASVPGLPVGSTAAILLQIAADVGVRGGFVMLTGAANRSAQIVFWSATSGTDRTRAGFLVVPVSEPTVHLHYEAGSLLTADVVGYVTGATAPDAVTGLVVPTPAGTAPGAPVRVEAGQTVDVPVATGATGQPAKDQVSAALLRVSAIGDAVGGVAVHAAESATAPEANLVAAPGAARATVVLVPTAGGAVKVSAAAGAQVTLAPQALILS